MKIGQRKYTATLVSVGLCFFSQAVFAVFFEPGVGVGLQYSDNIALRQDDPVSDLVTIGYVGARLFEDEGALTYDGSASINNQSYAQDTFTDQRLFDLRASADWAMVKERFNWFLSNYYSQRTINTSNANTPNNLQDSNAFTFGANIRYPVSARHTISLIPMFNQYYYEVQRTDNKQYSLVANWNYKIFRLTNLGFNLSARKINYTETDLLGQPIVNTRFITAAFVINAQRHRSNISANLGSTNVKRDNGQETSGFSGYLNWLEDLSSRSSLAAHASTDLTDTSTAALIAGDSGGVQITTDVVRDTHMSLTYLREDTLLRTLIEARYTELTYSDNPLDRVIYSFNVELNYPATQLLSSALYANYNRIEQLEYTRFDDNYTVGGNLKYYFSRKLKGLFDMKYRTKESTVIGQNYDEFSVFISLVYGFGDVRRPTSVGGF